MLRLTLEGKPAPGNPGAMRTNVCSATNRESARPKNGPDFGASGETAADRSNEKDPASNGARDIAGTDTASERPSGTLSLTPSRTLSRQGGVAGACVTVVTTLTKNVAKL
jgi:hypothetical protein